MEYLGVPKDNNDWLKYQGRCNIFTGIKKIIDDIDDAQMKSPYRMEENEDTFIDETESDTEIDYSNLPWEMQEDEDTKRDIITALEKEGVRCESVEIERRDIYTGIKYCVCVCYYNKPYAIYHSEFFLEGLSGFEGMPNSPLEFYFEKLIE